MTDAPRVHAIEADWLERMGACVLYRYDFDAAVFEPWMDGSGKRVSQPATHTEEQFLRDGDVARPNMKR